MGWNIAYSPTLSGSRTITPSLATLVAAGLAPTITNTGGYSTSFPSAETPISEGGKWNGGLAVGLDWDDVNTSVGKAYAKTGSVSGVQDSLAILKSSVYAAPADQQVIVVVHHTGGYSAPGSHEIELLLRWGMSAHSAPGYECLVPFGGGGQIIRQNGPYNDYTTGIESSGSGFPGTVVTGDIIRAKIVGQTISIYYTPVSTGIEGFVLGGTDNSAGKITSGQPGMGFFVSGGGTPSSHCISSWSCGPAT